MRRLIGLRAASAMLAVIMSVALAVSTGSAQSPAASALPGLWRNADTTIRVVVNKTEARATFVEVGQGAQALGFKPGEASFVATVDGQYMHGEQVTRYAVGGTCFPSGRKVPMIGRMTADGTILAIHFYNIIVDPNCRDTGPYDVTETLWQRQPGR